MELSEVLDEIRKRVGEENLTDSCSGDGCQVDMTDVPRERIVVDVERVFQVNHRYPARRPQHLIKAKIWIILDTPRLYMLKYKDYRVDVHICHY